MKLSHAAWVQFALVTMLSGGVARADLPVPQDDPNNYKGWTRLCTESQRASILMMMKNLSLRIKALAEDSKALMSETEVNEMKMDVLGLAADGLESAAELTAVACPPVAITLAVGAAATHLVTAYAQWAVNNANAGVGAKAEEMKRLKGFLDGWIALWRACCTRTQAPGGPGYLRPAEPLLNKQPSGSGGGTTLVRPEADRTPKKAPPKKVAPKATVDKKAAGDARDKAKRTPAPETRPGAPEHRER